MSAPAPTPDTSVRHALIVGGTKGLGRTLAAMLALDPTWRVSVIGRHPPPQPVPAVAYFSADLHDQPAREAALQAAVAKQGTINLLVFCQKFRGQGDVWAGELAVTLTATKDTLLWAHPHFARTGLRSIVLVGSVAGHFIVGDQLEGYHVAKAGLESLARYYAVRWGSEGIRVNLVAPSAFIKEESREHYAAHPEKVAHWAKLSPLQRMGSAEDVAEAILFLGGERAAFITGQTLVVDGGMGLRLPSAT